MNVFVPMLQYLEENFWLCFATHETLPQIFENNARPKCAHIRENIYPCAVVKIVAECLGTTCIFVQYTSRINVFLEFAVPKKAR